MIGGVVELAAERDQRLRRIRADGRPDKGWRQARDSILRPAARTALRTTLGPVGGLLGRVLRL